MLIDGAHNPPAAAALRQELDRLDAQTPPQPGAKRRWLIAMQRHKAGDALLGLLLQPGDAVRMLPLPEHSSWSSAEIEAALSAHNPALAAAVELEASSGDLRSDLDWLVQSDVLPVACGSLYLVAQLLPLLPPD